MLHHPIRETRVRARVTRRVYGVFTLGRRSLFGAAGSASASLPALTLAKQAYLCTRHISSWHFYFNLRDRGGAMRNLLYLHLRRCLCLALMPQQCLRWGPCPSSCLAHFYAPLHMRAQDIIRCVVLLRPV